MRKRDKRWVVAGIGVGGVLLAVGLYLARGHGGGSAAHNGSGVGDGTGAHGPGWNGFAAGASRGGGVSPEEREGTPQAPAAAPAPPDIDGVMSAWRVAVQLRDADTVVMLDRAFAEDPIRFGPALVKSARGDEDERVRAFSSRVLGKLRNPELVDLFAGLLDDRSAYVRQNAAWALGELGGQPLSREVARKTMADLRRLERRDAAPDVRAAAGGALKRLQ